MNNLKINIGTEIDLTDLLQSRLLIQANSGGGKSVLSRKIMEESYGNVPYIVFDRDGEYYTLKEKCPDVIIIGGSFADLPIALESAALLPAAIVSQRLTVIIDLSDMKSTPKQLYVKAFLEAMMELTQRFWTGYFVFIEEAHFFCGEQDKNPAGASVRELMSGGRKKGFAGILITQRISKLHKDAAAECNNKFVGRTVLDIDMDRAAKELGFSKAADRLKLRDLEPGSFYAYGTSVDPHFVHEVRIELPVTQQPRAGSTIDFKPGKPDDKILAALQKLNELPQEEKQVKPEGSGATDAEGLKDVMAEFLQYKYETEKQLQQQEIIIKSQDAFIKTVIEQVQGILGDTIKGYTFVTEEAAAGVTQPSSEEAEEQPSVIAPAPVQKVESTQHKTMPIGELRILKAAAQYPNGLNRPQLTVITGFKRSSRDAYIARLKQKGIVDQNGDRIVPTALGIKTLGPNFEKLPTGKRLQDYWQKNLPEGEWRILRELINHYPHALSRDELTKKTNYLRSSRDAYIARLKAKELVVIPELGKVTAAKILI